MITFIISLLYIVVCCLCYYRIYIQNHYPIQDYYPVGNLTKLIQYIFGKIGLIIFWPFIVTEQIINHLFKNKLN